MKRSRSKRLGRNDPCPCGSGKKYKRCCLESGAPLALQAREAPSGSGTPIEPVHRKLVRGWPPEVLLRVVTALKAPDVDLMMSCFEALPVLMEQGGPLAHLRFDDQRLTQAINDAMDLEIVPTDEDPYITLLFRACAARIGTPELVEALIRDAGALVVQARLPAPQLDAAGITALTCALITIDDYEFMPALETLFKVQIRERETDLIEELPSLLSKVDSARTSGGSIAAAIEVLIEENRPLVERWSRSPLLRGLMERHADDVLARVDRLIQERELPPMLTLPEILRLTAALLRTQSDPKSLDLPIPEAVTSGMAPVLIKRLAGIAAREETPQEQRLVYADLAQALVLDPGRYIMAGFLQAGNHAPLARDPRDLAYAGQFQLDDLKRPGALDEFAALLREIDDPEGLALMEATERDLAVWRENERA